MITFPAALQQQIVAVLKTLPNFHDPKARQALILSTGLDEAAKEQLEFDGATALFCQRLVNTLSQYGTLQDGRHALTAVLTGAIGLVGREGQAECRRLIAEIEALPPSAPPEIRRKRRMGWISVSLVILGAASVALFWLLRGGSQPLAGVIQNQRGQPLSGVTVTLKEFPVEATTGSMGQIRAARKDAETDDRAADVSQNGLREIAARRDLRQYRADRADAMRVSAVTLCAADNSRTGKAAAFSTAPTAQLILAQGVSPGEKDVPVVTL